MDIVLHDPMRDSYVQSISTLQTIDIVRLACRHNCMPPENFQDQGVDVRKVRAIRKRRQPLAAHNSINFRLGLFQDLRMKGQRQKE